MRAITSTIRASRREADYRSEHFGHRKCGNRLLSTNSGCDPKPQNYYIWLSEVTIEQMAALTAACLMELVSVGFFEGGVVSPAEEEGLAVDAHNLANTIDAQLMETLVPFEDDAVQIGDTSEAPTVVPQEPITTELPAAPEFDVGGSD